MDSDEEEEFVKQPLKSQLTFVKPAAPEAPVPQTYEENRQRFLDFQKKDEAPEPEKKKRKRLTMKLGYSGRQVFYRNYDSEDEEPSEDLWPAQPVLPHFGRATLPGSGGDLQELRAEESPMDKPLKDMNARDWKIFRGNFDIRVRFGKVPLPIRKWEEASLPNVLYDALMAAGYERPTPVQMQALPIGLAGLDLIALAHTGSGKTVAFLLPAMVYLQTLPPLDMETGRYGPYALICAPTRELCSQILTEAHKFTKNSPIRCQEILGGRSEDEQALSLAGGTEILVATPGRLMDFLDKGWVRLSQCNLVVLDEADKMMDLDLEVAVQSIFAHRPNFEDTDENPAYRHQRRPQTQVFSATMMTSIEELVKRFLVEPTSFSAGEASEAKDSISQLTQFVQDADKPRMLLRTLKDWSGYKALVFCNEKRTVEYVGRFLKASGKPATLSTGAKSSATREENLEDFRSGKHEVMVASNLMARGIDVPDVDLVVNYDFPKQFSDYVHRIGRTGRATRRGTALSFLTEEDEPAYPALIKYLESSNQVIDKRLMHYNSRTLL